MSEIGHNSELTDEQRQALFFDNLRKIKAHKTDLASIQGKLRNQYKVAKADGFAKKEIDFALKLEDDDGEILEQFKRQQEIAVWMSHPLGHQASFLDEDQRPSTDKAHQEGRTAGLKGEDCKSPYSGALEQKWIDGWHEGQAVVRDGFVDESKTAVAQIVKRDKKKSKKKGADDEAVAEGDPWDDAPVDEPAEIEESETAPAE